MPTEVTVGIDIGTTSVKAVAADADGRVLSSVRTRGALRSRRAGELGHDAARVWRDAVLEALGDVVADAAEPVDVAAVNVSAMVPSLCAVDGSGRPISDGLLYGDERGRGGDAAADPSQSGELARFLAWLVREHPDAAGFWPAQAVANHALTGGVGAIDSVVAMTALPLFDFTGWDEAVAKDAGLDDTARLPKIVTGSGPIGTVPDGLPAAGAVVGPGTIDAFGEQLVSGAVDDGDVLVIVGSTIIVWAVTPEWVEADGVWTVPHTTPGKTLVGGPSNAGGLFMDWVRRLIGDPDVDQLEPADLTAVPVWQPYVRGERVPLHDPDRRASLHDLHIGMGPAEMWRAAGEGSAFAVRHILDLAGVPTNRIVATGGGVQSASWMQALADGTGLPVDVVAVPQGAALGTAYLARVAAELEPDASDAGRWARTSHRVEPDERGAAAAAARYERYRELSAAAP